jgi:hypothetical protein
MTGSMKPSSPPSVSLLLLLTSSNNQMSLGPSKEEIQHRLNLIKLIFGNPEFFDRWVSPSKMKKLFKSQHKKISDALEVLRSLAGPVELNSEISNQTNLARVWLYEASEVNPDLSAGLVGYDIATFDSNFVAAIESLEKVEEYFSFVLNRAESSVKGRGENKPEKAYADYLVVTLCKLYRDITGEIPKAYLDKDTELAKGKIIEFLDYILRLLPYPGDINHWALEMRLRRLKVHEIHGQLWTDIKR